MSHWSSGPSKHLLTRPWLFHLHVNCLPPLCSPRLQPHIVPSSRRLSACSVLRSLFFGSPCLHTHGYIGWFSPPQTRAAHSVYPLGDVFESLRGGSHPEELALGLRRGMKILCGRLGWRAASSPQTQDMGTCPLDTLASGWFRVWS